MAGLFNLKLPPLPTWLKPPGSINDDNSQDQVIVHWSLLALMVITVILILNYLWIGGFRTGAILSGALVFGVGLFILNGKGYTQLAGGVLVMALIALTTGLSTLNWGTRDEGLIVYPLIILVASLVLSKRWYPWMVGLTLAGVAWLFLGERIGVITSQPRPPFGQEAILTIGLILFIEAIILRLITQNLKHSLNTARRTTRALEQQRVQLSESEARFRLLFEQSPEPLLLMDPSDLELLRIVDCNPAFAALSGYAPEELVGQSINFLQRQGESIGFRQDNIQTMQEGVPLSGEVIHFRKDGAPIRVQYTSTMVNINGRRLILGAQRDVTEQRRIEEESHRLNAELELRVHQRTQQLEAAYRELESFSYTMSHDLRTPLRGMVGFSQILMSEYGDTLPADVQDYLRRINQNSLQMGKLIDDLLDFLATGRRDMRLGPCKPAKIARQALELLPLYQGERTVDVVIEDMPACTADAFLLEKVFSELLSNAIKFTREKPQAKIQVGALLDHPQGSPVYFVRDNGVGFEMHYAAKIFGMFNRLHLPEEYEGTGVGLALVQRIISRHSGQVWAESVLGQGTTVYFTLEPSQLG